MNTMTIEVPEGVGKRFLAASPAQRKAALFALVNELDNRSRKDRADEVEASARAIGEALQSSGVTKEQLERELGLNLP